MLDIVTGLAADLIREFEHEPAQIQLDQYDDPEIDDHYLTFTVRLPTYDDNFMDRLRKVTDIFGDALTDASGWVVITSDFGPIAAS